MTIKELAKLAGVSYSTVSKALNNSSQISAATRERIKKLAEQNNFFINVNARNLKSQKSNTIALIFTREDLYGHNLSQLSTTILLLVVQEIEAKGYNFLVNVTQNNHGESYIRSLYAQGLVDGFLLASQDISPSDIEFLQTNQIPFAYVIVSPEPAEGIAYFINDNRQDGYIATKYLIDKGLRNIITVTSDNPKFLDYHDRTEGYLQAINEFGLKPMIIRHSMDHLYINELIAAHMDHIKAADALYIQWDGLAGVVLQKLMRLGYRVPEDISIMGHNDFAISTYFVPMLTTVHDAMLEQSCRAVEYIVRKISGEALNPVLNKATGYVIERESVIE